MLDKQSRNLDTDGRITRTMIVNIKNMANVCSNTFLSIFLRSDTIVFRKMSLLHWLTKLTHQTLYREKTIREVLWRQCRHEDWMLKAVSEIAFCFILTIGFKRIVIRTWFTETILVPIIVTSTFIIITAVAVFIALLFLLLLSPWLCWCSSCHYWCWCDCRRYCCNFCSIVVVIITSLFVLFNTCSISSCFQRYHCYFCVIVISIVLLLLFFCCRCYCHYYCISFFITMTIVAWVLLWWLL